MVLIFCVGKSVPSRSCGRRRAADGFRIALEGVSALLRTSQIASEAMRPTNSSIESIVHEMGTLLGVLNGVIGDARDGFVLCEADLRDGEVAGKRLGELLVCLRSAVSQMMYPQRTRSRRVRSLSPVRRVGTLAG